MNQKEFIEFIGDKRFVMHRTDKKVGIIHRIDSDFCFTHYVAGKFIRNFKLDYFTVTNKKAKELLGETEYNRMLFLYPEIVIVRGIVRGV